MSKACRRRGCSWVGGRGSCGPGHSTSCSLGRRDAPLGQRVQSALCAPGEVAAQAGRGVLAGGVLETAQAGSHRQPQLISEGRTIRREGRQVRAVHHPRHCARFRPPRSVLGGRTGYSCGSWIADGDKRLALLARQPCALLRRASAAAQARRLGRAGGPLR